MAKKVEGYIKLQIPVSEKANMVVRQKSPSTVPSRRSTCCRAVCHAATKAGREVAGISPAGQAKIRREPTICQRGKVWRPVKKKLRKATTDSRMAPLRSTSAGRLRKDGRDTLPHRSRALAPRPAVRQIPLYGKNSGGRTSYGTPKAICTAVYRPMQKEAAALTVRRTSGEGISARKSCQANP